MFWAISLLSTNHLVSFRQSSALGFHTHNVAENMPVESGGVDKDGVYISGVPGEKDIFIGYVPSEEEMTRFMQEAGFRQIEARHWCTKKGFCKLTLVGEK